MRSGIPSVIAALAALWMLARGARALLPRQPKPRKGLDRIPPPAGRGLREWTALMISAESSLYYREGIQKRLRLLARDIAALDPPLDHGAPPLDDALASCLEEDSMDFRRSGRARSSGETFLQRTEDALDRLERLRHRQRRGDP